MILTLFFGLRHQFGQKKSCISGENLFFSFLILAINSAKKRFEFLAKIFLFWSAVMVAARWNLVRTECGPLLQKITDPCSRVTSLDGWQAFANCVRTSKFNIFDNQALLNSKFSSLLCLLMYCIIKKKKKTKKLKRHFSCRLIF